MVVIGMMEPMRVNATKDEPLDGLRKPEGLTE